jgi:hypothetical protein
MSAILMYFMIAIRNTHVFCFVQPLEEFVEIMANLNLPYPKKIGDFTSGIRALKTD